MSDHHVVSRRHALRAAGVATASVLFAGASRTPVARLFDADPALAASCASLTPAKEIGPYFVEEKLNRSDITIDPGTGAVTAGVPLTLTWTLLDEDKGCVPLVGTQVDIWHADPNGKYSDEAGEGTSGKKNLRGYQVSDANGQVTFKTIYPGWYPGRAVHIHARIRLFDSSGNAAYDFLTQLFFDDAITDAVYRVAPYSSRGTRDTRDSNDRIYGSDGSSVLLTLAGDTAGGYLATFTFGLSKTGQTATSGTGTTPTTPTGTTSTKA
jgi:protocatechuate 3,4-dioxygenase beta subunit